MCSFSQNNRRILYQNLEQYIKNLENGMFAKKIILLIQFFIRLISFNIILIFFKMKSKQLVTQKDLQQIKVGYRTVLENYYQKQSDQNISLLLVLNALITQTISTKDQSDSLLLISTLESMKVKVKSNISLYQSTQNLMIHLKNPLKVYLKDKTIQEGLDKRQIYSISCMIINRFYQAQLKPKSDSYNWKQIIIKISKNCDINMPIALQTLIMLLSNYPTHAKEASKSGMIKYLCSVYLEKAISDKYNLYRSLKLLKIVAHNDRSVLPTRQKYLALVIYKHPAFILIVQEISQACYQHQYSLRLIEEIKGLDNKDLDKLDIDSIYVWSYNSNFSAHAEQDVVDVLQNKLKKAGKGIAKDTEWKLYSAINNLIKGQNQRISESWRIPIHEETLNAYLKLAITMVQKNPKQFYKHIDMKTIQDVHHQSKVSDSLTPKLIKDLKNLDPSLGNKTVGKLSSSLIQSFSVDQNPEILMQKASKNPKNNQQLGEIEQLLNIKPKTKDQFQNDTIRMLKNKAIQSLKNAIRQKNDIKLANVFNNLNLNSVDPEFLNRLIKLGELYLTKNFQHAVDFDSKKFLQILQWLEDNHGDTIIDWIAAGQMLSIIFGPQQWEKHLNQIPKSCFWLLNSVDGPSTGNLMTKINSLPQNHPKASLILGYISKNGDKQLKKLLLKSKLIQTIVNQICNYKNPRVSVKSTRTQGDGNQNQEMKKHLRNVLNLSYYIYNWDKSQVSKQIQAKIIKPCYQSIMRSFHGTQQQIRFIENCLPYKINIDQLKDLNPQKLLQNHGKLTSYLYNNNFKQKIQFNKIPTISSQVDPSKIEEILKFLQQNPNMIEGNDLMQLLEKLLKDAKKHQKYWEMFPFFISILNHIVDISSKSQNPDVLQKLTQILQKILHGVDQNQDISPQQMRQLLQNINNALKKLLDRNIKIDTKRIKQAIQRNDNKGEKDDDKELQQEKNNILKTLKKLEQSYRKTQAPKKFEQSTKVIINVQKFEPKPQVKPNIYSSEVPVNRVSQTKSNVSSLGINKTEQVKIQPLNIKKQQQRTPSLSVSNLKINFNVNQQQKKDENIFQGAIDVKEITKKLQTKQLSPQEKRLFDAIKMLMRIIQKKQPKQIFPQLVQIFLESQFNSQMRYLLGHLLIQYYEVIQQDPKVIALLQFKQKTNLCKQACLNFLTKFEQAFIIAKRWKLIGLDFMSLSMDRVRCTNKNKSICIQNGSQIAQYNLTKEQDFKFFVSKKYDQVVLSILPKIEQKNQAMYYFLLIGTSAKEKDTKLIYSHNNLQIKLLNFVNNPGWLGDPKISANISYALSSLVYNNSNISLQVAKQQPQILKLMQSYRNFATKRPVVESGCSLLSNLCYSNQPVKQLFYKYRIVQLLLELFNKNLEKPEISTYKQIMRTLGNISLHLLSAEKLINNKICKSIIKMIQKFNILIYRDDQKLKVLRLTVDFFSNIANHKYNLIQMHEQGVTNFVITILETTQISQDQVLMGCIDTIDGLCQNQIIENYLVTQKKIILQLMDLLKIKQDEKLITKTIRLLTNMTLNQVCIPYMLQANALSVIANIVMPVYKNDKIDKYIEKLLTRIFSRKPNTSLILKSGYMDCLIKAIQLDSQVKDDHIEILSAYCNFIPNYLNHRAFFNIVKVLTTRQNQKETIQRCFKIIRIIFSSEERDEDDIFIEGSIEMYDKLLKNAQNKIDIAYLIGLHCTKSKKFKIQLKNDYRNKKTTIIQQIHNLKNVENAKELSFSVLFAITNKERLMVDVGQEVVRQQDFAYKMLKNGFQCKLFRMDGSSKSAKVDINQMYMIRAYKYPAGQLKKKYIISVRQLRDWQFDFDPKDEVWRQSVFAMQKGVFESKPKIQNCVTLLGTQQWGQFALINLQFSDIQTKIKFVKAISALVLSFKS